MKDIGYAKDFFGEIHDTRLQQYYSVLKGLEYINAKYGNKNISIKIRTDQFLNLEDIVNQIISKNLFKSDKLMFPFALEGQLFSINDYFIAGNTSTMLAYFSDLVYKIDQPVASKSIHVDLVQKYLELQIKNNKGQSYIPKFTYAGIKIKKGSLIPIPKSHIIEWIKLIEKYFLLSEPSWIENSTVRGKSLDFVKKKIFNNDLIDQKIIFQKLIAYSKRRVVKDNLITKFIFKKLKYTKNSFLSKFLYKINYYLRIILLSL